jgi:iron complex transport system permease protein
VTAERVGADVPVATARGATDAAVAEHGRPDASSADEQAFDDTPVAARGLPLAWAAGAVVFLLVALLIGVGTGPFPVGMGAIAQSALSHLPLLHIHDPLDTVQNAIVWQVRGPRVALGALVGGMLAVAGASYQGVFRNPLADPYLLGVSEGAGLGATLAIVFASASGGVLPLAAFAGSVGAGACAYLLGSSAGGGRSTGPLILAGVTVAAFMTAIQTFVQQTHTQDLREVYSWILGGLTSASWHQVAIVAPYIVVSSLVLVAHGRILDVLSVGDEEAASLGLNVRRTRLIILVVASTGTAAAVAVSGLIGFVGVIVPHTIRLLVSSSYRALVPLSLVVGAGFLVLTDVLARTVLSPDELPLGVVTAFFGAPFFAVVLRRTRWVGP